MAYDYPYRLEHEVRTTPNGRVEDIFTVWRSGDKVCTGKDHTEMRRLVDAANRAAASAAVVR